MVRDWILDFLPKGALLYFGEDAIVEITGLRNPCQQLNLFQEGLMQQLVFKNENGELVRKAGVMGIVLQDGLVKVNDRIVVAYPAKPHQKLERV